MRGCDIFLQSLVNHGVEKIFGNPGTTESPLLDRLADYPQLEYITALHEGIAVGAATHYAQAAGKTPVVNVHVAPGLGNTIGMIYNALKARSPMIVTAGQQDTRMRLREPVLGHDLVAMAAPVCKWAVQVENADEMPEIIRRAVKIANEAPAGPVFVALPINVMEEECQYPPSRPDPLFSHPKADAAGLTAMAEILAGAERPAIISGDDVASRGAVADLVQLAEALGAHVWHELLHMQLSFPNRHACARGPLGADAAAIAKALDDADCVLLVGDLFFDEVWHVAASPFPAEAKILHLQQQSGFLAHKHKVDLGVAGDLSSAIAELASLTRQAQSSEQQAAAAARLAHLNEQKQEEISKQQSRAERSWNRSPASMARLMSQVAEQLPDNCILVDETITASLDLNAAVPMDQQGDYFGARGGGIGQGIAGALGVQVARPDRPVLCLTGDGSAMYSVQAFWTAAHHHLPIVFLVLANREYRVLKHNLDSYRQRFEVDPRQGYPKMDLAGPVLDYVSIAKGMGVTGRRIDDPDDIAAALAEAFAAKTPYLLEIAVEGKPA